MDTERATGNKNTGHDGNGIEQQLKSLQQRIEDLEQQNQEQAETIENLTSFGTNTSQKKTNAEDVVRKVIDLIGTQTDGGAPVGRVIEASSAILQIEESHAEHHLERLRQEGEVYEPTGDRVRTT